MISALSQSVPFLSITSPQIIVLTSWEFKDMKNISLSEIHHSLLYGFELLFCYNCGRPPTKWETILLSLRANRLLVIPLAILVFLVAGVSLPVTIIIGLTGVLVLSFTPALDITAWELVDDWPYNYLIDSNGRLRFGTNFLFTGLLLICLATVVFLTAAAKLLVLIIMGFVGVAVGFSDGSTVDYSIAFDYIFTGVISDIIIMAPRIIIFPFVMWFLIYKFRRRHLSMYNRIESFLRCDNKLTS